MCIPRRLFPATRLRSCRRRLLPQVITVVPRLDPDLVRTGPQALRRIQRQHEHSVVAVDPGCGWVLRGSTQVQLGPDPDVDPCHRVALRAALMTGERLEVTDPGESEDIGNDWAHPAALTEYGDREPTEPWTWAGPARTVSGHTWGGCIEIIQWILTAGRFPTDPAVLDGGVLILEASEEIIPAQEFGWILRSLGERGLLTAADAVLVARPPASSFDKHPSAQKRAVHRAEQRDVAIDVVSRYNPDAVVCVGVPFGHTRPQWILPSAETSPLMAPSSGSGPITGKRDPHTCRRARLPRPATDRSGRAARPDDGHTSAPCRHPT